MSSHMLLCVFALSVFWSLGNACRCKEELEKSQLYEKSDFVALIQVKDNFQVVGADSDDDDEVFLFQGQDGFYPIKMNKKTWKFPKDVNVDMGKLYTPADPGMCRLGLRKGRKYLISGTIRDGKLYGQMCDSLVEEFPIGKDVKRLKKTQKKRSKAPKKPQKASGKGGKKA